MKALVTTGGFLLLVDLETKKIQPIECHQIGYYGISWTQDTNELVLGYTGVIVQTLDGLDSYALSEQGYITIGEHKSENFLSQPHQIFCAPNGWVIVANTGRNCVSVYDPKTGFIKELRVNDKRWDRLSKDDYSGDHFNSVYMKNDRLYIVAHAFKKQSYVLEYSYPELSLVKKHLIDGCGFHNVWVNEENHLMSCHSEFGEILDITTGERIWATGFDCYYTRGVGITKDIMVIGSSEIAPRAFRSSYQSSGLWIIDRKTMKTLDLIPINLYGPVHEVRIIDEPDLAHHGIPFKNIEALERRNYWEETKGQKLKRHFASQRANTFKKDFHFIYGNLNFTEDGWIKTLQKELTLMVYRKTPQRYTFSIDYSFDSDCGPEMNHLSIVLGYQGQLDDNMLAVFMSYQNNVANLGLWQNQNNDWSVVHHLLVPEIPLEGQLSVTREKNKIQIQCGEHKPVTLKFDEQILNGHAGVRAFGTKFKNPRLIENGA